MLYEKIREQLRRKEDEYSKEVEKKQQLELTLRALEMELKTVTNNQNQVELTFGENFKFLTLLHQYYI